MIKHIRIPQKISKIKDDPQVVFSAVKVFGTSCMCGDIEVISRLIS